VTIGIPTLPPPERRDKSSRPWVALALMALVVIGALAAWWQTEAREENATRAAQSPTVAVVDDTTARAPRGVRVRVRVVNSSGTSGLARRATQHLRDYGFDVVDFTTGRTDQNADTRITVHTGHADWASRLKKALGVGTIGTDADTSRFVDLTVFVGRDWRPPAETLRP
jgi:hypothetical protein